MSLLKNLGILQHTWSIKVALSSPVVTLCAIGFNIQKSYVLPIQCIYVFCVDLRTNSSCVLQL